MALKFIAVDNIDTRRYSRFIREVEVLKGMSGLAAARPRAAGLVRERQPYLVSELLAGATLKLRGNVHQADLEPHIVRDMGVQLLVAVREAHMLEVAHRGIRPSNVFVGPTGLVSLIDWAMAGLIDPDSPPLAEAKANDVRAVGQVLQGALGSSQHDQLLETISALTRATPEKPSAHQALKALTNVHIAFDNVLMGHAPQQRG